MWTKLMPIVAGAVLIASVAESRVVRFVVEQRRPFADGANWGTTGPYERLDGTAHFEIDPRDPLNAVIVNLDKAPRNARGLIEFSAPFYILKPVDPSKGNRKLFYGINNRGGQVELLGRIAPGMAGTVFMDPITAEAVGDGLLMRLGYSYVDAGWHGDGTPAAARLFPKFPVATQRDGSPLVEMTRVEMQPGGNTTFTQPLVGGFRPEPAADLDTSRSVLTERLHSGDPRTPIASDRWAFGRCPKGKDSLTPSPTDICLFDGFKPQHIYELVYPARDPVVMGLAHAVTRDVASFLRFQARDDAGNANPLAISSTEVGIRRAYASGSSSTGMYLREWLYLGFNEDETHRRVFDGVIVNTAGTHRLFANVAFAHPTFYSGQDQHHDFVSNSVPPFTYAVTTDPITGVTDGILKRPATDPLVIQVDGEFEFWSWKSSLNVVDGTGKPVAVPRNVRLYLNTASGHAGSSGLLTAPAARANCQNPVPPNQGSSPLTRALTVAMDEWADRGIEPPKSNFPRLEDGTLVTLDDYRRAFPAIPGAPRPQVMNELSVLNFGPLFGQAGGTQTILPPASGASYKVFVPKADADGIGLAGVRPLQVRVPLGTNLGWNVMPGERAPDMCGLSGSFIPFAVTKAERQANGDPRLSLEERYKDRDGFVRAVTKATKELVAERFLLEEDAARFVKGAQDSDVLRPKTPDGVPSSR